MVLDITNIWMEPWAWKRLAGLSVQTTRKRRLRLKPWKWLKKNVSSRNHSAHSSLPVALCQTLCIFTLCMCVIVYNKSPRESVHLEVFFCVVPSSTPQLPAVSASSCLSLPELQFLSLPLNTPVFCLWPPTLLSWSAVHLIRFPSCKGHSPVLPVVHCLNTDVSCTLSRFVTCLWLTAKSRSYYSYG